MGESIDETTTLHEIHEDDNDYSFNIMVFEPIICEINHTKNDYYDRVIMEI
jgi:hypothetical protein